VECAAHTSTKPKPREQHRMHFLAMQKIMPGSRVEDIMPPTLYIPTLLACSGPMGKIISDGTNGIRTITRLSPRILDMLQRGFTMLATTQNSSMMGMARLHHQPYTNTTVLHGRFTKRTMNFTVVNVSTVMAPHALSSKSVNAFLNFIELEL